MTGNASGICPETGTFTLKLEQKELVSLQVQLP